LPGGSKKSTYRRTEEEGQPERQKVFNEISGETSSKKWGGGKDTTNSNGRKEKKKGERQS